MKAGWARMRAALALVSISWLCSLAAAHSPPIQLLVPDKNRTGLAVVESALEMIERIEGPVAVVAITGPYHTGKSFLMNQLAQFNATEDAKEAFAIGRGVDPETSGIWMYHRPVPLAGEEGSLDVLFLDTEGFSVSNVSETYDAKVFAASTMLSSLLLYNSMHLLHASELEYLDLLVHNTQLFSIKTSFLSESHNASAPILDLFSLPPLLISVQAFTVNLKGEACSSWLSRLLQAPVRSGKDPDQHMGLGSLFPSVACNTLFLPATSLTQLNNLHELPRSRMTSEFRSDLSELSRTIGQHLQPKTSRGRALTGPALAALIRLVVSSLASGGLADIPGRWDLFEAHLRQSSTRACLMSFEKEVRQRIADKGRPLTGAEFTAVANQATAHAGQLLERLLLGLDASLKRAQGEASRELREAAKVLQLHNTAAIKVYLRDKASEVAEADRVAATTFRDKGLPVPSKQIEEWAKQREASVSATYKAASEVFKGEASFTAEAREVAEKAKGLSDSVRLRNQAALDEFLEGLKAAALDAYRLGLDKQVGEGVHLPDALSAFHASVLADAVRDYEAKGGRFKGEKPFDLHLAKLKVDASARLTVVRQENSERIRAVCSRRRSELASRVAGRVGILAEEVFDEEEMEKGLAAAASEAEDFAKGLEHLKTTSEYVSVKKELDKEIGEMQRRVRVVLAERIKRVLQEPLNEVCRRIIEAKCPQYTSVAAFTKDTMKECAYFVRKHDIGRRLSDRMMTHVITQFIETDLRECRDLVAGEEARQGFWRKVTVGVGAVLALAAYFKYQELTQPQQGRQRPYAVINGHVNPRLPQADFERYGKPRQGDYM